MFLNFEEIKVITKKQGKTEGGEREGREREGGKIEKERKRKRYLNRK
jgi:hypothetical protein